MKPGFAFAALIAVSAPTFAIAIEPSVTRQAGPPMNFNATLAESHLRAILKSATPGSVIDYSLMTPEVAQIVRDHPESGEMIVKPGAPQAIAYLGPPPGGHLFRITFTTAKIDFFIALNAEGKVSSMYYHPAVDMPS